MASRLWRGLSAHVRASLVFGAGWGAIGAPGAFVIAKDERERGVPLLKSTVRGSLFGIAWPITYTACLFIWVVED